MEILYHINSITELNIIQIDDDVNIRWLKMPDDYDAFCEHLREQYPTRIFSIDDWLNWDQQGTPYCGLFKKGKIVARAAAEKYLEDKWETADVRVNHSEREKDMQNKFVILLQNLFLKIIK